MREFVCSERGSLFIRLIYVVAESASYCLLSSYPAAAKPHLYLRFSQIREFVFKNSGIRRGMVGFQGDALPVQEEEAKLSSGMEEGYAHGTTA